MVSIYDKELEDIYRSRVSIAHKRQKFFNKDINELDFILCKKLSYPHPYLRDDILDKEFQKVTCYEFGNNKWYKANTDIKIFYHLDSLKKLLIYNTNNKLAPNPKIGNIRITRDIYSSYKYLNDLSEKSLDGWVKLDIFLNSYQPDRGITWWTNSNLGTANNGLELLQKVHRLGIINEWVNDTAVIMRLDMNAFESLPNKPSIWIPSVIDAHRSEIFKAVSNIKTKLLKCGYGINLTDFKKRGDEEYIIRGDILSEVYLKPIKVTMDDKQNPLVEKVKEGKDIYSEIIKYH